MLLVGKWVITPSCWVVLGGGEYITCTGIIHFLYFFFQASATTTNLSGWSDLGLDKEPLPASVMLFSSWIRGTVEPQNRHNERTDWRWSPAVIPIDYSLKQTLIQVEKQNVWEKWRAAVGSKTERCSHISCFSVSRTLWKWGRRWKREGGMGSGGYENRIEWDWLSPAEGNH